MRALYVMTKNPTTCTPSTRLEEVARLMVEHDCGCIPVLEGDGSLKPVGTVTDRDIVCRTVAKGKNPLELTASDCMSQPCVTVSQDADINECVDLLEHDQIRRLVVVDENGNCCGIVAQADIVRAMPRDLSGELVYEVSRASEAASAVH